MECPRCLFETPPFQFTGESVTAKPNDLAACQVTPGSEWILAKVIQHDPATGMYKLSDEDVESNKSTFDLSAGGADLAYGVQRSMVFVRVSRRCMIANPLLSLAFIFLYLLFYIHSI